MGPQESFASEKEEHQFILDDHNTCCLCGTQLEFKHEVDFLNLKVRENATCPSCKIDLKPKEHTLN